MATGKETRDWSRELGRTTVEEVEIETDDDLIQCLSNRNPLSNSNPNPKEVVYCILFVLHIR